MNPNWFFLLLVSSKYWSIALVSNISYVLNIRYKFNFLHEFPSLSNHIKLSVIESPLCMFYTARYYRTQLTINRSSTTFISSMLIKLESPFDAPWPKRNCIEYFGLVVNGINMIACGASPTFPHFIFVESIFGRVPTDDGSIKVN